MAHILLVADKDNSDVAGIAYILVRDRHRVTMAESLRDLRLIAAENAKYQIVIVDLTRNRPSDWRNLDDAVGAVTSDSARPMVLAFSSVYRGVAMKIYAERRGSRFIWI